jgi:TolA-binding protein
MSEFKRLLEDPSTDELEADLLRFARSEGPSQGARAKILAAVGAGVLTASSHGGSALATQGGSLAPAAKGSSLVKWALLATSALVPAGIWLAISGGDAARPLQPNEVAPPAAAPAAPAAAPEAPEAPVTKVEDLPVLEHGSTPVSPAAAPSLADEVKVIQRAKAALSSGNATGALRELDAYRRSFPRGRLAQEATVLRIEALAASGNQSAASRLGEQFLKNNEKSPYARRVKSVLGK